MFLLYHTFFFLSTPIFEIYKFFTFVFLGFSITSFFLLYHTFFFLSIGFLGIYKFFTFVFPFCVEFFVFHRSFDCDYIITRRLLFVNRFFYVLRFAQKSLQCFMQNDEKRGVCFWQKVE